jgi:hypothetical protein
MRALRIGLTGAVALSLLTPAVSVNAQDSTGSCEPSSSLSIIAEGNEFDRDCLAALPDQPFALVLENKDRFSHNVSIYTERGGDALFTGEYVTGNTAFDYEVPAITAGNYLFVCDIHPNMQGVFLVAAESQGPDDGPDIVDDGGRAPAGPTVQLEQVATGLTAPVFITSARDGSDRLFIVDQSGVIRIVTSDGELLEEPFLSVRDRIVPLDQEYDERGLLGLAFHPSFAENGRFFAYYSAPLRKGAPEGWNHTARLSEFRIPQNGDSRANKANPEFEKIILEIDQPQGNHNGGHIAFGPDGFCMCR